MREILFRGKKMSDGRWVYGDYHKFSCTTSSTIPAPTHYIMGIDTSSKAQIWVDPATVGQYTGLTDKNGVKIFEGDICDFTVFDCLDNDTQYRGVVVYSGSRFMLWKSADNEYYGADGGFDLDWVVAQDDEFEIIGNIHDNQELFEGGQQCTAKLKQPASRPL